MTHGFGALAQCLRCGTGTQSTTTAQGLSSGATVHTWGSLWVIVGRPVRKSTRVELHMKPVNSRHTDEPTPFFVVGTSRSGTTMFALMLNAHSELHVPNETWFLSDLMDELPLDGWLSTQQVESALSIVLGHWRWREWGVEDRRLANSLRRLDRPTLAEVIDSIFSLPLADSSKVRWGDKTPGYTTEIERLHHVFPRAQFLHIIRDGRDVCLSLKKTGWHGETIGKIADYWAATVAQGRAVGRTLPRGLYMEVPYERLVLSTEEVLGSVCTFLGVGFEAEMLRFYHDAREHILERARGHLTKAFRPPRKSDVARWKREMTSLQVAIFESFAGSVLEQTGYERRFPLGGSILRSLYSMLDWTADVSLPVRQRLGLHFPRFRKKF